MPGFDGTGPMGQGPMTGGGFGYCAPGDALNTNNSYYRRGRQRRFFASRGGMERGRGFRYRFYANDRFLSEYNNIPETNEKEYLENELKYLEQEMNSIKTRLEKISNN